LNQNEEIINNNEESGNASGLSKTKQKAKKRLKISEKKNIVCEFCKTPASSKGDLLTCKQCEIAFCVNCERKIRKEETFFDGIETRQLSSDYPLCENCYRSNLQKHQVLDAIHHLQPLVHLNHCHQLRL